MKKTNGKRTEGRKSKSEARKGRKKRPPPLVGETGRNGRRGWCERVEGVGWGERRGSSSRGRGCGGQPPEPRARQAWPGTGDSVPSPVPLAPHRGQSQEGGRDKVRRKSRLPERERTQGRGVKVTKDRNMVLRERNGGGTCMCVYV